jgi:hypothetical protein
MVSHKSHELIALDAQAPGGPGRLSFQEPAAVQIRAQQVVGFSPFDQQKRDPSAAFRTRTDPQQPGHDKKNRIHRVPDRRHMGVFGEMDGISDVKQPEHHICRNTLEKRGRAENIFFTLGKLGHGFL